jgi:protease-4
VVAHIDDLGASAAYWIASQADKITANQPSALVGSIGTIQVIYDQSAAAEQQGIRPLVFATGPLKGLGTPGTKVTEEQAAHVQSLVDSVQVNFDAAVMKGRRMSAKELAAVRHGGVMTATQALNAKLIDAIQPLGKTIVEMMSPPKAAVRASTEVFSMLQHGGLPALATSGDM